MRNTSLHVNVVVVGMGILGLVLAKRLLDLGQTVAVIEKSPTIAHGASIKNHGWLHQGTTHSLSANSDTEAQQTVKQLQYGYNFFKTYAPECFDEPFAHTYAVTNDPLRAYKARSTWTLCGVPFKEMTAAEFQKIEPGMNPDSASFFFEVGDSRINNRLLFMKLFTELKQKGAFIFTGANYDYEMKDIVRVSSQQGTHYITSSLFFYATGANLDESYRKLTGATLGIKHYKSHLLYVPRVTNTSIIGLDDDSPIIINHGDTSIVNRPHDHILATNGDYQIDPQEIRRSLDLLARSYAAAHDIAPWQIRAAACLKPSAPSELGNRLSINASVHEPMDGHLFALPGKMTTAPYVADELVKRVSDKLNLSAVTPRPFDAQTVAQPRPSLALVS